MRPFRALVLLLLGFGLASSALAAEPSRCPLFPIALSADLVADRQPGDRIASLPRGGAPGHFGFLSWSGQPGIPRLAQSLLPPGDDESYVNPDDPDDALLDRGDWVSGVPGALNASAVREALETLKDQDIVVAVWDQSRSRGAQLDYRGW